MRVSSFSTRPACPSREVDPVREPIAAQVANFVTIEIRTDCGLVGIGYAGFVMQGMLKPLKATLDALAEWTVGEDPLAVEAVSQKLLSQGGFGAPAGLVTKAAAAIDVALWDIKGKAAGMPLYRLLGGGSARVPAYASGHLWRDYDTERLASKGASLVQQGFWAMKFRMGAEPDPRDEIRRMRALRAAVGASVKLMVDINQGWDVHQTMRMGRAMEESQLFWIEDPIHHQDYEGMARISQSLAIPLATGEYHYGIAPFRHMLDQQCVDIVMVDLLRAGGITHWMKVAHLAEASNKPVVSHLAPEVLAHCVAAAPNGLIVEHMPWALPLFKESPPIDDGEITLPDKAGLGLEFDHDAIKSFEPR